MQSKLYISNILKINILNQQYIKLTGLFQYLQIKKDHCNF